MNADEFVLECSLRRGSGRLNTAGNRWAGTPIRMQAFVSVSLAQRPALF